MPLSRLRLSVAGILLSGAILTACGDPGTTQGPGDVDGLSLSDEEKLRVIEDAFEEQSSAVTYPGADCTNAAICTGPVAARAQCYAASTEASFRFETLQTFNVPVSGEAGFVRLLLRRLFNVPPDSTAVVKVEIRELTGGPTAIDSAPVVASGTYSVLSLTNQNAHHTVPFSQTVRLHPATGPDARYALLARIEGGRATVGVGCSDTLGAFAGGWSTGRKRLRISGTAFTSPTWLESSRDLSFALGFGCAASSDGAPTCAGATEVGTLSVGEVAEVSGTIPYPQDSQWYRVEFPLEPTFQLKGSGTPTISFETNGGDRYRAEFYTGGCGASPSKPGGPFTSFSFGDTYTYTGGSIAGGEANPCVGAQCAATPVASNVACAITDSGTSILATSSNLTCGCDYATPIETYATPIGAPTEPWVRTDWVAPPANPGCPFLPVRTSGVGSYGARSEPWPTTVWVKVTNTVGAIPECLPYTLRFSR